MSTPELIKMRHTAETLALALARHQRRLDRSLVVDQRIAQHTELLRTRAQRTKLRMAKADLRRVAPTGSRGQAVIANADLQRAFADAFDELGWSDPYRD